MEFEIELISFPYINRERIDEPRGVDVLLFAISNDGKQQMEMWALLGVVHLAQMNSPSSKCLARIWLMLILARKKVFQQERSVVLGSGYIWEITAAAGPVFKVIG